MKDILRILKNLNQFCSVSGNEKALLEYVYAQLQPDCDEIYMDTLGNLIVTIGQGKGETVLFSAHADTIGFIVHCADEEGYIHVAAIGGVCLDILQGRHVVFSNGIEGVIVKKKMDREKELDISDFVIDIGVSSKSKAETLVSPGTFCGFYSDCFMLPNKKRIISAFLDNRINVILQIEVIKAITKIELKNKICFVFSTQEEVGMRGVGAAVYSICPKYAVSLDVTSCSAPDEKNISMKLDKGACIKIMDKSIYCHEKMVAFLRQIAEKKKISYQYDIFTGGGTDAGVIQKSRSGVYTGGISIPVRYVHSPCEMVSLNDYENAKKLVIESIAQGFDF